MQDDDRPGGGETGEEGDKRRGGDGEVEEHGIRLSDGGKEPRNVRFVHPSVRPPGLGGEELAGGLDEEERRAGGVPHRALHGRDLDPCSAEGREDLVPERICSHAAVQGDLGPEAGRGDRLQRPRPPGLAPNAPTGDHLPRTGKAVYLRHEVDAERPEHGDLHNGTVSCQSAMCVRQPADPSRAARESNAGGSPWTRNTSRGSA